MPERLGLPAGTHAQKQKGGRYPKADGVAQTIQLRAKFARTSRQTGHIAVERIEQHGGNDQPAGQREIRLAPFRAVDFAGAGDGREAADGVAQGQQSW